MQPDEPRARIGHRNSAVSKAKLLALKALVVVGGVVTLASAFVLSVAFLAIGLVVVLAFGGYLWWKTRELRRQMRERIDERQWQPRSEGDVIEGEVIEGEVIRTSEIRANRR
jgi:hypothetical protein